MDLSAFRDDGAALYTNVLADELDDGREVDGFAVTAQTFVVDLMTPAGSVPRRAAGTNLVPRLRTGVANEAEAFAALAVAVNEAARHVRSTYTSADPPAAERLSRVRLGTLRIAPGSAVIDLTLVSEAGNTVGVVVPLSFNL